jgi:hypothetical protein
VTFVSSKKAKSSFLKCLPSWNCVAMEPSDRSGGLLIGWNPILAEFNALGTNAGIYLEGRFKNSAKKVKLLNCYAPYKDHEIFW